MHLKITSAKCQSFCPGRNCWNNIPQICTKCFLMCFEVHLYFCKWHSQTMAFLFLHCNPCNRICFPWNKNSTRMKNLEQLSKRTFTPTAPRYGVRQSNVIHTMMWIGCIKLNTHLYRHQFIHSSACIRAYIYEHVYHHLFVFAWYGAVPLKRRQFSPKSSQKTSHSWPVRARYGVSFVNITSDEYILPQSFSYHIQHHAMLDPL